MKPPYKPTTKDFETFKREFLRCIEILNLNDWRLSIDFIVIGDGCFADVFYDTDAHTAHVRFAKDTLTSLSDCSIYDPKATARHECCHVFTATLERLGRCRYVIPDQFGAEVERMARVLEKLL